MSEKPAQEIAQHSINYIEFSVGDMARAKGFYGKAFGWRFTDYGPDYAGIVGATHEQGGFTLSAEPIVGGGPLVVLYSHDLEASRDAVIEAGGTITQAIFSFPGGRRFHFRDSEGNELAVWSLATEPLADA